MAQVNKEVNPIQTARNLLSQVGSFVNRTYQNAWQQARPILQQQYSLRGQLNRLGVQPITRAIGQQWQKEKPQLMAQTKSRVAMPPPPLMQDFPKATQWLEKRKIGPIPTGKLLSSFLTEAPEATAVRTKLKEGKVLNPEERKTAFEQNLYAIMDIAGGLKTPKVKLAIPKELEPLTKEAESPLPSPTKVGVTTQAQEGVSPIGGGEGVKIKAPEAKLQTSEQYLKELVTKQQQAKGNAKMGLIQKGQGFLADVKEKMVDATAPIEDVLSATEKKGKFQVLPEQDVRLQIDRVLRSKTLAGKFTEDNGLVAVIRQAPDLDALDQYMIAKQANRVRSYGIKTGRDAIRDEQLIKDLGNTYEPFAQQVNQYTRKLLQYSVDSGLLDQKLANELVKKYPEYVPINRIFSALEQGNLPQIGRRGIASLSRQSVIQKLKGSERQITSPIESILAKTQDAFNQGERNKAARILASYKDLPGFEGLIREVQGGRISTHTFSYLDDGVKRTFETTPEIATAAKNLNMEQMGLIGKIFSIPTRVLQLGATGLNVPFAVTNLLKDQVYTFINSSKAAKTSLLNPANFVKSLFSAVKHDDLYSDMIRQAGGGTSYDIARQAPTLTVQKIRAGRGLTSEIAYTVTRPLEFLRAVENIVGRTEELTRIQNYRGTLQALLKEGRTPKDAKLLAAKAARETTANFLRKGTWGRVLNWTIPFFNAGIQGSRQLVRSFQNNPKGTTAKVVIGLFLPVATATAWNLSDPQRAKVYQDIESWEKENNLIIVPENPTKDEKGRWNVIKIPLPPGLSNLTSMVRRPMEQAYGLDPVRFGEVVANLITAGTSIDVTGANKLASTFTPQAIKPFVESYTNTNLYTGRKIVPEYMKSLPPEMQVKSHTSPLAKGIGGVFGVSPLMVENAIRTAGGGVGSQILGENMLQNIQRRFSKASGGTLADTIYDNQAQLTALKKQMKDLMDQGKMESAIAIMNKNKVLFENKSLTENVYSKVVKLTKGRNKILKSNLTQEQKNGAIAVIDKQLYELSVNYQQLLAKGGE